MKSLGERLLELRERYVASGRSSLVHGIIAHDEWEAIVMTKWPNIGHDPRLLKTVAIERAAVRELKKEGKL